MKKLGISLIVLATLGSFSLYSLDLKVSQSSSAPEEENNTSGSLVRGQASFSREFVLGSLLKNNLEGMHFSKKRINDDLSEKAFKEYLERIDYGKQFLLQEDVDTLAKYKDDFDNEMVTGNLRVIDVTSKIMDKRLKDIKTYIESNLSKVINLEDKDSLETDPKKRKYRKSFSELQDLWRRILKYEVLNQYVDLKQEQEGTKDSKNKSSASKPKVVEKILTPKELEEKSRKKVLDRYSKFFKRLMDEKRNDKLDKFYNSITKIFDPHTHYLIPDEKEDFDIDMSGKLEGIGALLKEDGSHIRVDKIIPGSASWKQKELKAEDVIIKVGQGDEEPVDVVDMSLKDAVKLIRGPKGSTVKLTVKKPDGLSRVIPIVRDTVEIEESYVKGSVIHLKSSPNKIGYAYIPKFYRDFSDRNGRNCTDDLRNVLQNLLKKGVDGLVLDLRNNGGGALEDARLISGLFVKNGPIVQVKDSAGVVEVMSDNDSSIVFDKPMVVLINRFSASASEIVAAALQDYKRAIIIGGEHSHGKGTVQAVVDLDNYISSVSKAYSPLGALKITIQTFYRVNGSSTQYKGVTPDIILPDPLAYLETGEKYLDYSIPWSKVDAVKFEKWSKPLAVDSLKGKSNSRVVKSSSFQQIKQSIEWFNKRKEQSNRSIKLSDYLADRDLVKKANDNFENSVLNQNVVVIPLNETKTEEDKERFKEYSETLQKDPYIEETLNIVQDML